MPTLPKFDHLSVQVVGLVGVVVQEAPWLLVLSYHQYGDLKSLLDVCRSNEIALRLVEQLVFCVQICKGMVRTQLPTWTRCAFFCCPIFCVIIY